MTTTLTARHDPAYVISGAWDQATWRAQRYVVLGLFTGILGLVTFIVTVVFGATFSALIFGIPVLLPVLAVSRGMAELERRRAAVLFGVPIARPYPPVNGGLLARIRRWLAAPATWRDLAHHLIAFPVQLFAFVVSVAIWAAGLGSMSYWAWYWAMPNGRIEVIGDHFVVDSIASSIPWIGVGLGLCWIAGWLTKGLAAMTAAFAALLLGPSQAEYRNAS
jgi:hypothetical protein